jgi:hypothetical protein
MEEVVVSSIIDCLWRLQRLTRVEAGAYAPVGEPMHYLDIPGIGFDPYSIPPDKQAQSEAVNLGAIEIQFAFSARSDQFELIQRYEAHLDRKLRKATEELERLQFARINNAHPYYIRRMRRFAPLGEQATQAPESADGISHPDKCDHPGKRHSHSESISIQASPNAIVAPPAEPERANGRPLDRSQQR